MWTLPSGVNEGMSYPLVEQQQPGSPLALVLAPPSSAFQDKSPVLVWLQLFSGLQQTLFLPYVSSATAEQEVERGRVLVCMWL